jgi:hypothetical protein
VSGGLVFFVFGKVREATGRWLSVAGWEQEWPRERRGLPWLLWFRLERESTAWVRAFQWGREDRLWLAEGDRSLLWGGEGNAGAGAKEGRLVDAGEVFFFQGRERRLGEDELKKIKGRGEPAA